MGNVEMWLPPRLRYRRRIHGQQENKDVGAAGELGERGTVSRQRAGHFRLRTRPVSHETANRLESSAQLFTWQGAGRLHAGEASPEMGQAERWAVRRKAKRRDRAGSEGRRLAHSVRRWHV